MAKKSMIAKNERRKATVQRYAAQRAPLVAGLKDPTRSYLEKLRLYAQLAKLPRDASPTRLVNRDVLDGRPRGFYRKFGLSRIQFRRLALAGELPGVTKSSW